MGIDEMRPVALCCNVCLPFVPRHGPLGLGVPCVGIQELPSRCRLNGLVIVVLIFVCVINEANLSDNKCNI